MYERLASLGYNAKRIITFQSYVNEQDKLQALHDRLGKTEFLKVETLGFCNGELTTDFVIPSMDPIELQLLSLSVLTALPLWAILSPRFIVHAGVNNPATLLYYS